MASVKRAKSVYCEPLKEWVILLYYDDGTMRCPDLEKRKQKGDKLGEGVEAAVQAMIDDYRTSILAEEGKA